MSRISEATLREFEGREDFHGYGYLGSTFRTEETDRYLVKAANALGIGEDDLFLWCNSKNGRWAVENSGHGHLTMRAIMDALPRDIDELHASGNVASEWSRELGSRTVTQNADGTMTYGPWRP